MKIAVPVANGKLAAHFGHCEQFRIIEIDDNGTVQSMEDLTPPPHEPGVLPAWLAQQKVDHIIAGGMGMRAAGLFKTHNISVTIGAPVMDAAELAKAYMAGTLVSGDNLCDH